MLIRWTIASLHLLALGIGLGAIWVRALALRGVLDAQGLRRVMFADTLWGVAALVWISTGLYRLFGGLERGTGYYFASHAFWLKMSLLGLVLLLEVWPMSTLIRWRIRQAQGLELDTRRAGLFAGISMVQALLVIGMVFAATAMARGLGY